MGSGWVYDDCGGEVHYSHVAGASLWVYLYSFCIKDPKQYPDVLSISAFMQLGF